MQDNNTPEQGAGVPVCPITMNAEEARKALGLPIRPKMRTGSRECECGRPISANKLFCWPCVQKYQREDYVREQAA